MEANVETFRFVDEGGVQMIEGIQPKSFTLMRGKRMQCKATLRPPCTTVGTFTVKVLLNLLSEYEIEFNNKETIIIPRELVDDGYVSFHD